MGVFVVFRNIYIIIYNIGWILIRIRMNPELLPRSGSGTRKIQSWIRIRNKSFWIHTTAFNNYGLILATRITYTLYKKGS